MIEKIDIGHYLNGIELVVVGGESDAHARPSGFIVACVHRGAVYPQTRAF